MIVIADSGSTKTDWVVLHENSSLHFKTQGINPFFLQKDEVIHQLTKAFPKDLQPNLVERLYFYGPACSTDERCVIVANPLKAFFTKAQVHVESDLLGSARALFQDEEGIACILGTGSNSGLYNGQEIIENITSTGFILGDEGSGAHLGLELAKKYINHQLETETEQLFFDTFNLSAEQIIDKVYKSPYPNRFLASLSPFIYNHIHISSLRQIAENSFSDFIDLHILPYRNAKNSPIACVGSVAYYYQDVIKEIAQKKGLTISQIVQKPIQDLIRFHE